MVPRLHFRHRGRHLNVAQHPTRDQPVPNPAQRLLAVVIAAPGGLDLLRMGGEGDWTC